MEHRRDPALVPRQLLGVRPDDVDPLKRDPHAPHLGVDAVALTRPAALRFTVATAKNPVPVVPGMFTIPSPSSVAARATMSGVGVVDADSRSVSRPLTTGAPEALAHRNVMGTSMGANDIVGLKIKTKLRDCPGGMSTGTFGEPTGRFVVGSVC